MESCTVQRKERKEKERNYNSLITAIQTSKKEDRRRGREGRGINK